MSMSKYAAWSRRPRVMQQAVATYSIVACDRHARQLGVAVQSRYFSVGSIAPSALAGVGVAIIQSIPKLEYSHGTLGLELLRDGASPAEAMPMLVVDDEHRDYRQIALVNNVGEVAAFTGRKCVPSAGHVEGDGFSCQANMVTSERVWLAMKRAFWTSRGDLADRLLDALEAGEKEGGDVRGKQSASLTVVSCDANDNPLLSRPFDLRVEDDLTPLVELRRLVRLQRAYQANAQGIAALATGDDRRALLAFERSEQHAPDRCQLKFWRAVALMNADHDREALRLFDAVFAEEPQWRALLPRLEAVQLLKRSPTS